MMPTVYRLLFACFFCTLWGGAVIADDGGTKTEGVKAAAAKAKEAEEATQWALNNLTEAEWYANNLTDHLDGPDFDEAGVKKNTSDLADAVKNASDEVEKAKAAVKDAEDAVKSPSEDDLKTLLTDAAKDVDNLSSTLTQLNTEASGYNSFAQTTDSSQKEALNTYYGGLKNSLKDAKGVANKALESLKKAVVEASKTQSESSDKTHKKDGDLKQPDDESGPKGNDKQDGQPPTNLNTPGKKKLSGTGGDKSSPNGLNNKNLTSSSTHESDTFDGAHGGAIATCTAAPLLLLLTAAAYAAMC